MLRYYTFSLVFTAACFGLGLWYAIASSDSLGAILSILWIILILSILEVSLSFDNAVVNATVLREMDEVWQQRFLVWGIAIAVFGTRIVFPLAIVAVAANIGPIEAIDLSLNDPERYEQIVSGAHVGIAGFGGAFLSMVGLKFFFDADKDVHWIGAIERQLVKVSSLPAIEIALLMSVIWFISAQLPDDVALTFLTAGIGGLITFIAVDALGEYLNMREEAKKASGVVMRSGLGGFLYLEVLDASFSFDGVIGAFALSNNMVIIALGLSIGAMFVRSMTIHLVRAGTLAQYRYLEHGAFWAIIALGAIMLTSAIVHIPETITGLIGVTLIGISFWWSLRHNKREAAASPTG
ncbi:membrane protein [Aurantiacibacter gangjinensis]|uniref:Membrane protein n=1 Tax=Aurantiacibacter gangjinensis TaxID=502682 RepID=A0A0G9MSQ9_9SPHN|nr:membrane protein [Aurantiacibacter gangjinensis]